MGEITFREMHITDYEAVYGLWKNTPGLGLSRADSQGSMDLFFTQNPGLSLVAEKEGQIIGTILCGQDGRRGYLYHLTIRKEERRMGLGRRLIDRALERLKALGINKCHLFVFRENQEGIDFWKGLGWEERLDIQVMSKGLED